MHKIFKLRSGGSIIAIITDETSTSYKIQHPHEITNTMVPLPGGHIASIAIFKNWLEFSILDECWILKSDIMQILDPVIRMIQSYEEFLTQKAANPSTIRVDSDQDDIMALEEMEDENYPAEEHMEEGIEVSFYLPKDMFLAFLAKGIMGLDEDRNIDFDTDAFMEHFTQATKKSKKKPSKKDNGMNFGKLFDKWNPHL